MKALSDANTDALLWAPSADVAGHYELVSGEDVVALLIREKGWRKPTIAQTLDGEWRIHRESRWSAKISMWRSGAEENTAVYLPDRGLGGPGRLATMGDHRWEWRPRNRRGTEWAFMAETGGAIIGFRTGPWIAGQDSDQVKVDLNAEAVVLPECLPLMMLGQFLLWRQEEINDIMKPSRQFDPGASLLEVFLDILAVWLSY